MHKTSLRIFGLALAAALAYLPLATTATAQSAQQEAPELPTFDLLEGLFQGVPGPVPSAPVGDGPDALYINVGVTDGDGNPLPVPATPHMIDGFGGPFSAVLSWTGDGAIEIEDDGIVLKKNGVYKINAGTHIVASTDDETGTGQASAGLGVIVDGRGLLFCITPKMRDAKERPGAFTNPGTPTLTRYIDCQKDFTIEVHGKGDYSALPLVFPRNSKVQFMLFPNAAKFPESALFGVNATIIRVGR